MPKSEHIKHPQLPEQFLEGMNNIVHKWFKRVITLFSVKCNSYSRFIGTGVITFQDTNYDFALIGSFNQS